MHSYQVELRCNAVCSANSGMNNYPKLKGARKVITNLRFERLKTKKKSRAIMIELYQYVFDVESKGLYHICCLLSGGSDKLVRISFAGGSSWMQKSSSQQMAGIDLSGEVMTKPPKDIGINRWYARFPSRGLDKPGGRKRARRDCTISESESEPESLEAEAEEPEQKAREGELLSEDDESRSRWSRLLSALKTNMRLEKNERDFSELRIELKLSQYSRQKKAHPIPTDHPRPLEDPISQEEETQLRIAMERSLSEMRVGDARSRSVGGPIISEEESQLRMAMERSFKEIRDKKAARSKGKEKLPGSS
ncbi:hypothetical protein EZV62_017173 [Acer yangbiense]|uniref:Uncharacterized protein n=1 Tax=Acer yangbiense TaxID=1000413 RepID=A0A5C7HFN7_9ROSI|nr:hypothetical protein EZV62_017173 [Acer yangbiense]